MNERIVLFKKASTTRSTGSLKEDGRRLKDYLSKEKKGEIKLYGFLRRLVFQYMRRPVALLTNLERAAALEEIWKAKLKEESLKEIAHRIVLSLDPKVAEEMAEKGIPVDGELHRIVAETMERYQDRFYSGHQLGYLVGIRHDQKQIHAHILLYPQTAAGKPINVSNGSKARLPDGTETKVDYQGFIKATAEILGVEMYANRVLGMRRTIPLPEEFGIQEKLLTEVAFKRIQQEMQEEKPNAPPDTRELVSRALGVKNQLMKMSDQMVRQYLEAEYERRVKAWDQMTRTEAEEQVRRVETLHTQIKKDIDNLYLKKGERYEKAKGLYSQRCLISAEAFRAKNILLGWRQYKLGSALFTEQSEGRWWMKRMGENDELGSRMERIHNDLTFKFREIERLAALPGTKGYARLKQQEIIQQHLAEMQQLKKMRSTEAAREIERQGKEKEEKAEMLARYRLLLQRVSLQLTDARAKLAGRPPRYHQQYAYWKKSNRVLPISLARKERPDPVLPSNAVLMNRQEVIKQLAPATREEYLRGRDKPQDPADEICEKTEDVTAIGLDEVTEISEEVVKSHVGATPAIALMCYSPREIVTTSLDREAMKDAMDRHREALRRFLRVPHNDRIGHIAVSPRLAADDIRSFDQIDF